MHLDSHGFMDSAFAEFSRHAQEDKVVSILMAGDNQDMTRTAVRKSLEYALGVPGSQSGVKALDNQARKYAAQWHSMVRPFGAKVDGMALGNHTWRLTTFENGSQTRIGPTGRTEHAPPQYIDERMADSIGSPFAEGLLFNRYKLCIDKTHRDIVTFAMRHGKGGGRTQAADQNKLINELAQWSDVDVFMAGHTHHCYATNLRPKTSITGHFGKGRVKAHRQMVARLGTFDRHLLIGSGSTYGEDMGMPPATIGYVAFKLWMENHLGSDGRQNSQAVVEATARTFV
jgi:hypothetical protein